MNLTGMKNPVMAALRYLQVGGVDIDEASFERVAEVVGDSSEEVLAQGFVISGLEDLDRLCKVGKFTVAFEEGLARAYLPSEWILHVSKIQKETPQ